MVRTHSNFFSCNTIADIVHSLRALLTSGNVSCESSSKVSAHVMSMTGSELGPTVLAEPRDSCFPRLPVWATCSASACSFCSCFEPEPELSMSIEAPAFCNTVCSVGFSWDTPRKTSRGSARRIMLRIFFMAFAITLSSTKWLRLCGDMWNSQWVPNPDHKIRFGVLRISYGDYPNAPENCLHFGIVLHPPHVNR